MQTSHWVILAAMLGAVALQLSGLEHWADATNPRFVAGLLAACASTIGAMFNRSPVDTGKGLNTVTENLRSKLP